MSTLPSGTVTFLFTDIEDSTHLWQEQPEAMALAHAQHDEILHAAIAANNGYVFQIIGDSFNAAFHNAHDAFMAALTAQRGLKEAFDGASLAVKARMGINTGSAQIQADGRYNGYVTIASAQRVMSVAYGGQVLLSQTTRDLLQSLPDGVSLADLGEHQLRSLRAPLRLYQLIAPDLPKEFPPIQSLSAHPNNLPAQLTSFVGREKQLNEITRLLANNRMLTLIGPGGTGKTRLSLQLAEAQLPDFKNGVWFIELAPISDAPYVVSAAASVFNLHEVQGMSLLNVLIDYLRGKQLLLLFDNCEHLVEVCAQLANQLLHECPALKIAASSREALGISGETIYRVPSLQDDEAARLFIERAAQADSHFQVTGQNAAFIDQICARLDGIPLAIELAAARVKLFSPQQIAERLDDRFKLLTGGSRNALPRQQTLRALIDWSYQTLDETEQRTLRRLAVFSGGWTFEAVEAVAGEAEAFDGLVGLVNKSLVNVEEREGVSRYFFLETIRQYAMEKLVEAGEANETRNLHLTYVSQFVLQNKPNYYGMDLEWIKRLDSERDNLRAALEWAVINNIEEAISLALQIGGYWSIRDYISEALLWYRTILQESESLAGHEVERAAIYSMLAWNSVLIGQHREGRAAAETAIVLAKKSGAERTFLFSCTILALASVFLGDLKTAQSVIVEAEALAREKDLKEELAMIISTRAQMTYFTTRDAVQAKALLDESRRLGNEVGYRWETPYQSVGQGRLAAALGDIETARAKFNEGTELARRIGNKRMVYANRSELAHVLREHGHIDEALEIYRDIIPGWKEIGHRAALAHELECVGYILLRKEEPEQAVNLLSAAQAIRKTIDMPRTKLEDIEYERELSALKGLLGEGEFKTQWASGENLATDEAIGLALGK